VALGQARAEGVAPVHVPLFKRPLVAVADVPAAADERVLLSELAVQTRVEGPVWLAEALEVFLEERPESAWAASIRANLGLHYHSRGAFTPALEHWEQAWDAVGSADGGAAKKVGDFTLARWSQLLAGLGQIERLKTLREEAGDRELDRGPLSQQWRSVLESLAGMESHPDDSSRCGVEALHRVAKRLALPGYDSQALLAVKTGATGLSLKALGELGRQHALGLAAVASGDAGTIIVPSVVHWRQDHYGAIVADLGEGLYRVEDSALGVRGGSAVMDAADILRESSGYFLIPQQAKPPGWRWVPDAEASQVIGRAYSYQQYTISDGGDYSDTSCDTAPGNNSNDPATGAVTRQESVLGVPSGCSGCGGMPVWRVSEPYINVWLEDEPLSYQPAWGAALAFRLAHKQRSGAEAQPYYATSLGHGWHSPWLSRVDADPTSQNVTLYYGGGGYRSFDLSSGSAWGYDHNSLLEVKYNASGQLYYELSYRNGAKDVYAFRPNQYAGWSSSYGDYFLSKRITPEGFEYELEYTESGMYDPTVWLHLNRVIAPDGSALSFQYNNMYYPNNVTSVADPFGNMALLGYDMYGALVSLTDAAGLNSTIQYNPQGWTTRLATPYGDTDFSYTGSTPNRDVTVNAADGGEYLYLFDFNTTAVPTPWAATEEPAVTPNNFENIANQRNSYFWGPRQYKLLSTTNVTALSLTDFDRARLRHWIAGDPMSNGNIDTLEVERRPTPDGVTPGQTTWYDYDLRPGTSGTQKQKLPALVAHVLPNTNTAFKAMDRNQWGNVTNLVESWSSPGGTLGTRTRSYTYAANGIDLVAHNGPNNNLIAGFGYNSYHQVTTRTNAVGEITSFSYDNIGRLAQQTTPAGLATTYSYGTSGRLAVVSRQPVGGSESFTWQNGRVRTHTDARGWMRTFSWDALGRLTRVEYPGGTHHSYLYNKLDLWKVTDRLGHITKFEYDSMRRMTKRIDALTRQTEYEYCKCGALEKVTDALGQATLHDYDDAGRRTKTTDPDGVWVATGYNRLGQVVSRTNALGKVTQYAYNNQGLLTQTTNNNGTLSATQYDIEDRPVSVTGATGITHTQTFDALGRLATRTDPANQTESFGYAATGLASRTDPLGATTHYGYDAAGRRTSETNALGQVVSYSYSAAGDMEELQDGKGNITRWEYDTEGRPERKRDANNALMFQWGYDANGRLTNRQTPAKGITQYDYDVIGNLLTVDYPSSPDITYTYDALYRLDTMQDAIGLTDYNYTNASRLQTENGPWPSDTVTLGYNAAGQRSSLAITQPSAYPWSQTYGYDGGNRLQTIANTIGTFQYQYTPGQAGRQVAKLLLPGSGYISNTNSITGQLTDTSLHYGTNTNSKLNYHGYTHNAAGQRTRQTRTDNSRVDYTYDTIGQLTNADTTDALNQAVSAETFGYAYDDAWNLSTRNAGSTNEVFTVNNLNQLTGIPSGTPGYDTNGNLTSDGGALTCQYDDENQLISVESMSSWPYTRTEFEYDGKQRLRIRTEYQSSAGNWSFVSETRYIYDGMRVVEERNSSNQPTARYTRGTDLSGTLEGAGGIGGLLAMSVPSSGGWSHHFYHADSNGNITAMMDEWGYLSATYRYDPYGRTIAQAGPMASTNPYRFSSKEHHEATGLYYYGYRYYSPKLQRWLNRDPIAENGGINLYGFAGNQPSGRIDLYGHRVKGAFELIGGFIKKYIFNAKKPNANVGHRPSSPDNISKYTVWLEYIILWECRSKSNGEDECMILCMSFGYESTPYFNCWNLCINSYKARCAKLKNGQKTNRKSPILFIFPQ